MKIQQIAQYIDNQPILFGIKNEKSEFIYTSSFLAKQLGFNHGEELNGLKDEDLRCGAKHGAENFRAHDAVTLEQGACRYCHSSWLSQCDFESYVAREELKYFIKLIVCMKSRYLKLNIINQIVES